MSLHNAKKRSISCRHRRKVQNPSGASVVMRRMLSVFSTASSSSLRTRSIVVVRAVLLMFFSAIYFFSTQEQGQVKLVQAFAPPICKAATTTDIITTPKICCSSIQNLHQQQAQQQQLQHAQRQHYYPLLSFHRRRQTRPFSYSSSSPTCTALSFQRESALHQNQHVVGLWTSRSLTTQLASTSNGSSRGGGPRRGRPPKRSNSNDDTTQRDELGGTGAARSGEDDAWVDDVDIDILADGLEEDEALDVVSSSSSSSSIMMGDAKTTSKAAANDDVEIDDEYDEDDDALDELNIDDDDDEEDELEIEEEIVGAINDRDDESDEWDDDESEESADDGDEVDWDPDEDDAVYELEDDLDDPNYMKQKQIVQEAVRQAEMQDEEESFDALDFVMNEMTEQQAQLMDSLPFIQDVEEQARELMLEIKDFDGMDIQEEMNKVSDLMDDDPYPRHEPDETNFLQMDAGLTDDDMEELDKTYKRIRSKVNEEPWDKVMLKDNMPGVWDNLSQETLDEMEDCLQEIGGSAYNVTRWLLYDLDFNVTNLILSAIKHNPQAPIIFQHWYPQLVTYARYQHVRDVLDYDFTADHVEQADTTELERYYAGFGYAQIPTKMPAETGIISLEYMDEEEIKMAAFENWMKEVYNPEWDRKDFDDDDMRDEDNVFSEFYVPPQHPDLPTFEDALDDLNDWHDEIGHDDDEHVKENPEIKEYRDMMGEKLMYTVKHDEEFQKDFRGHLVVACTGDDSDLEIAEKITSRFDKEFGKQVYVETRVEALARQEDNVFEVWLESYEIDLLHSKKRATGNSKGWTGPANCDDKQIDYLVSRVRFLISDDARYSYRMDLDVEAY